MWQRWAIGCLYFAFLSSGITFNIIPPTFNDLLIVFNAKIDDLSSVYTSRSAGYLIGTILGGFVLNFFNRQLCLVVAYSLMAVTVAILPFCGTLRTLFVVVGVNGVTSGTSDVATNVWLLDMFKEKSAPYIQALYFFFAVGNSVAPLLSAPFLKENNNGETKIHFAYVANGVLVLLAAVALLVLFFANSAREAVINVRTEFGQLLCNWKSVQIARSYVLIIAGLGTVMFLVYSGFEIYYMQFMTTLVTQSKLNVTDTDAAIMNSAMNIAFTCFRGISVIANLKIEAHCLIYFDLFVLTIATAVLLVFINTSHTMLYVGNILMGVGFSSMYASIYAFIEKFIDVTNSMGSLFAFASGVTAIIYPPFIGEYIQKLPKFVLYLNVASILLTTAAFVTLHVYVNTRAENRSHRSQRSNE